MTDSPIALWIATYFEKYTQFFYSRDITLSSKKCCTIRCVNSTEVIYILLKIFIGQRVGGLFALPVDGQDPPAASVIEQLKAVDAAGEGLFSFGVTRFVGAPDMSDVIPGFNAVG